MDEHARPVRDRVRVQLERVEAVLERVLGADRAPRELPGLARRDEAAAEPVGERRAEDEAARLRAQHEVGLAGLGERRELLDGLVQRLRVREQRHDVLEDDPAAWESRGCPGSSTRGRPPSRPRSYRRGGARARRAAATSSCESAASVSRSSRPAPGAARGSASAAPARRSARAGPPRCRRRRGTCAGSAARRRSGPGARRRRRRPRRAPGRAARRPRSRGSRSPYSSSSRTNSRVDAGALAELVEVDPRPRRRERRPAGALAAPGRAGRRELLPDHAQRQELVALEPEDRLEALDVVLGEEPVAALRPARREQALVLEVADLRDRDVRELLSSLLQTAPIVSGRCGGADVGCCRAMLSSALQEGQLVLADLHLVPVLELSRSRRAGGSRTCR